MNISKLIEANKEIADLKSQLHEHDDQIKNIEDVNSSLLNLSEQKHDILVDEVAGLRAQVEHYQKNVCQMCDGHGAVGNILDSMECPDCQDRVNADNASAIKKLGRIMSREFGDSTGRFVELYANMIREGANE